MKLIARKPIKQYFFLLIVNDFWECVGVYHLVISIKYITAGSDNNKNLIVYQLSMSNSKK